MVLNQNCINEGLVPKYTHAHIFLCSRNIDSIKIVASKSENSYIFRKKFTKQSSIKQYLWSKINGAISGSILGSCLVEYFLVM